MGCRPTYFAVLATRPLDPTVTTITFSRGRRDASLVFGMDFTLLLQQRLQQVRRHIQLSDLLCVLGQFAERHCDHEVSDVTGWESCSERNTSAEIASSLLMAARSARRCTEVRVSTCVVLMVDVGL